ncbi:MAG TPA: EAL domain-containing protein [Burkholderiaceae bacterium]|nr:EAL domain-containing protein [Burkholderiaceae bacterium]
MELSKFGGLRSKVLAAMVVGMATIFLLIFSIARHSIMAGYASLEKGSVLVYLNSARGLINDQTNQLYSVTRDYAHWDDAYNFVRTLDPVFIESNLNDTTFSNLKIHAIIFVNDQGQSIFSKGLDFATGQPWKIPELILQSTRKGGILADSKKDHIEGLFWTPDGLSIVSSVDVRDSTLKKARIGTLIIVRALTREWVAQIESIIGAQVNFHLAPEFSDSHPISRLTLGQSTVEAVNDLEVAGYTMMDDVGGSKGLVLQVVSSRQIHDQGVTSLNTVYWSIGLMAVLLLAISWLFDKLIVSRLTLLSANVQLIGETADMTRRLPGDQEEDELGFLAKGVNKMLDGLNESQKALKVEQNRSQVTLSALAGITDAIVASDAMGRVTYMNAAAELLTGVAACDVLGADITVLFQFQVVDEKGPVESSWLTDFKDKAKEVFLQQHSGRQLVVSRQASPLYDFNGDYFGVVTVLRDVTKLRDLSEKLTFQARHDALTGLVNRYEFDRKALAAIEDSSAEHRVHCLAYLDLDQFKTVNDSCGHLAGDSLLKQLGDVLKSRMRESDTLARLGGDEFAVIFMGCTINKAESILDDIVIAIREFTFLHNEKSFKVGVSIGLTEISPEHPLFLGDLLGMADSACYLAKKDGGNCVRTHIFGDLVVAERSLQLEWVSRINQSLENDGFILHMQRMQCFNDGGESHCELLVRMIGESGELHMPGQFLATAERYKLMPQVDRWVIAKAFKILARKDMDLPHVCAINLSGQSLSDERLANYVLDQIKTYDVNPRRICFEITETAVIANLEKAQSFIHEMRKIGCRFSLDDFGSGLSSFAYLKNLKVDFLKIDGMFTRNVNTNKIDRAMVESITSVGHVMGLKVIAEFAETRELVEALREIGVDYAQGYGVAMPETLV